VDGLLIERFREPDLKNFTFVGGSHSSQVAIMAKLKLPDADKYIFDFDYTLFKTVETVLISSPRGTRRLGDKTYCEVTSPQFANYVMAPDESLDDNSFINFRSVDFTKATPIQDVLDFYEQINNKLILSARPHKAADDIRKRLGKDTEFIGLGHSDALMKMNIIKHYNKPLVFEDSSKLVAKLISDKINCIHVIHESKDVYHLRLYEFN